MHNDGIRMKQQAIARKEEWAAMKLRANDNSSKEWMNGTKIN